MPVNSVSDLTLVSRATNARVVSSSFPEKSDAEGPRAALEVSKEKTQRKGRFRKEPSQMKKNMISLQNPTTSQRCYTTGKFR